MPINDGLANLSHAAFMVTVVAYALAVLAYAGDFAFGREVLGQRAPAREPATDRVTVGVTTGAQAGGAQAGDTPAGGSPPAAGRPAAAADRRAMGRWVRVALVFTLLGLAAHLLGVVSRGLAVHRVPWGDMYEFVTTVTCVAVAVFVGFMIRYRAYRLGLFVLGPVVVLLGIAETVIYTPAGQLPPALQSYWLAIHVTSITLATGAFVVAALLAVSYLLADR